jgi:hypothetical protein
MAWLKTPLQIPERRALLLLPYYIAVKQLPTELFESLHTLSTDKYAGENPDAIERIVGSVIEHFRPDLSGATILWFEVHWPSTAYRIGCSHKNLPRCPQGAPAENILLGDPA